jgi:hypothetical protein
VKALMVGTALDTNGQKSRFVDASRRWGADPSVTKALIVGYWDGAGIPARLSKASDKNPELSIRAAHASRQVYFDFPVDMYWDKRTHAEVMELADDADLIHLTNDVKAYFKLRQARHRKPALLHHHGTLFRSQSGRLMAEARRMHFLQAVSTIDLQKPAPDELYWLPAPLDLDATAEIRELNRRPDDGVVRVVSAPTRRDLKSTPALMAAVNTLKAEGLPVELVLVEGRSWAECLAVKGSADIYFDQVAAPEHEYPGGYGCNAIEAWGMGIPVIAGADEWTTARMRKEWNLKGPMPFYEATQSTITDALRDLVQSPDLRAEVAARGKRHARKYHAEKPALTRLAELYAKAIAEKAKHADTPAPHEIPFAGGFFTARKRNLQLRLASQSVTFVDGKAHITDPRTAQRLRSLMRFDNRHGIAEVFSTEDAA